MTSKNKEDREEDCGQEREDRKATQAQVNEKRDPERGRKRREEVKEDHKRHRNAANARLLIKPSSNTAMKPSYTVTSTETNNRDPNFDGDNPTSETSASPPSASSASSSSNNRNISHDVSEDWYSRLIKEGEALEARCKVNERAILETTRRKAQEKEDRKFDQFLENLTSQLEEDQYPTFDSDEEKEDDEYVSSILLTVVKYANTELDELILSIKGDEMKTSERRRREEVSDDVDRRYNKARATFFIKTDTSSLNERKEIKRNGSKEERTISYEDIILPVISPVQKETSHSKSITYKLDHENPISLAPSPSQSLSSNKRKLNNNATTNFDCDDPTSSSSSVSIEVNQGRHQTNRRLPSINQFMARMLYLIVEILHHWCHHHQYQYRLKHHPEKHRSNKSVSIINQSIAGL